MTDAIHILLVDDDIKNSMLLKKFLEVEEYRVTYANNGAVGWELLQTVRPDLILLDINMPEMNGFELARKIPWCPGPLGPSLFCGGSGVVGGLVVNCIVDASICGRPRYRDCAAGHPFVCFFV